MYRSTELNNGLRVLTIRMPARESISLGVWTKVGSRYESNKLAGVSHFIEHLVFKGTRRYSMQRIKEAIEGKGGILNAFTSEESTCYYTKILSEFAYSSLDVLSDLVFAPLLKRVDMEKERTVILEEIKMYLDMPSSHVQEIINEMLWENQPLGRNIAGSPETVSGLSRPELHGFHQKFYNPANILITASGLVDHNQLVRHVKKKLASLKTEGGSDYHQADSAQAKPKVRFIEKATEQCHWVMGLHGLHKSDPDRYKLALLHVIAGGNMSSRLFNEVREKRGLAYSIHSHLSSFQDTGAFLVSAGVDTKKASLALRVSLKELKKIAKNGIKAEELRRAKDYYMGQMFLMLEDTMDHMIWAGERFLYFNKFPTEREIRREIEKVKRSDIQEMARRIFTTEHLNLALIGPIHAKEQKEIKNFFAFENC